MNIGDVAVWNQVHETVMRGGTFYAEYELFTQPTIGSECQIVDPGTPLDLSTFGVVSLEVHIEGVDPPVGGWRGWEAEYVTSGSASTPARVSVKVPPELHENTYADGGYRRFTFQLEAQKPGVDLPAICGTVDVLNSAGRA